MSNSTSSAKHTAGPNWQQGVNTGGKHWVFPNDGRVKPINAGNAETAALIVAAVNGYHTETEQSIAADCYFNIAETLGTRDGYSVQEHAEALVEVLQDCSDFLHDFDESSPDAVLLAFRVRSLINGRLEDSFDDAPPSSSCTAALRELFDARDDFAASCLMENKAGQIISNEEAIAEHKAKEARLEAAWGRARASLAKAQGGAS